MLCTHVDTVDIYSESVIRVHKKATETLELIVSFYVCKPSKENACSETHFWFDELLDNVDICEEVDIKLLLSCIKMLHHAVVGFW